MSSNFFLVLYSAMKIFLPLHPSLKLFLLFLLIIQALHSTSLNQSLSAILLIIQALLFTSLLIHALRFTFSRHSHSSFYFISSFTLFILILLSFSLPFTSPFPLASLLVTQALISTYLSLKPFHLHLSSSKLFLPPISSLKPLLVILWSFKLFFSNSLFIQTLPCTSPVTQLLPCTSLSI